MDDVLLNEWDYLASASDEERAGCLEADPDWLLQTFFSYGEDRLWGRYGDDGLNDGEMQLFEAVESVAKRRGLKLI